MKKEIYSLALFLIIVVWFGENCFAVDSSMTHENQGQVRYTLTDRMNNVVQLRRSFNDSTTTDSVMTDDAENTVVRVKNTNSSKGVKEYYRKNKAVVVEAGFPLSVFDFQYGATFRFQIFPGFGFQMGFNKFSYSEERITSDYRYNPQSGNSSYVYDTTKNSSTVGVYSFGIFGNTLISDKIDLVYGATLMANTTDLVSVFPNATVNVFLEGGYFFTKQIAGGVNVRGLFAAGNSGGLVIIPSAIIKVVF